MAAKSRYVFEWSTLAGSFLGCDWRPDGVSRAACESESTIGDDGELDRVRCRFSVRLLLCNVSIRIKFSETGNILFAVFSNTLASSTTAICCTRRIVFALFQNLPENLLFIVVCSAVHS